MARKLEIDWDEWDAQRMAGAVEEIAQSENLRFFFRSLLNSCGAASTPVGTDAHTTARLCGRHEVGMEIISLLLAHRKELYPALILEDLNEQEERI